MKTILTAALAALILSGCAINWPTKTSGPRFSWSSDTAKDERALRSP